MKAILSVLVVVALIPAAGAAQGVQTGTCDRHGEISRRHRHR